MARRESTARKPSSSYPPLDDVPPGRAISVRSSDGVRLHAEVFGPDDGYPIVLWMHQITDLSRDHRVIAFDHRGHGRSDVPRRGGYTLDRVADDLQAVLDATLRPRERAVIAGHSMGGVAITAWADRHRDAVHRWIDAVALINTTTGELLQELQLAQVPAALAGTRVRIAQGVIRAIGSRRVPRERTGPAADSSRRWRSAPMPSRRWPTSSTTSSRARQPKRVAVARGCWPTHWDPSTSNSTGSPRRPL